MNGKVEVTAQLVLKGGKSLVEARGHVTAETVEVYLPSAGTVEKACQILERYGFRILSRARTGITIGGDQQLFENTFSTRLSRKSKEVASGQQAQYWINELPVRIPSDLAPHVEAVFLPEPPTLFD